MSEPSNDRAAPEPVGRLSSRVFSSTAWNYVGHAATLLVWFMLTPFVVSELGVEGYALFVIATAVMGYGQLFELGLSSAVTRFVSELQEREEHGEARDVVATAFVMTLSLALLTTIIAVILAPLAPGAFGVSPELAKTTEQVIVVSGLTAGVSFTVGMSFGVLSGLQRFDFVNQLQIAATFLLAAFTIVALVAGLGVVWVVGAGIPTSLLIVIPALVAIGGAEPRLLLSKGRPRRSEVRRLLSFSWAIMFTQGASLIKGRTDEFVIAAALPVARVTPYALARRATESAFGLTFQFTRVIMPLAAQLGARNEHDRLRAVFLTGTRLTLASYLGIGAGLVALAGPFLAAWVGEEFRSAGKILVILVVAGAIALATVTAESVLQGVSKHRPLAAFAMFGAVLNLGLSIALVGPYGLTGVAVGTLVAATVESLLLTTPYTLRTLDVGIVEMFGQVVLPVLVPLAPAALVAFAISLVLEPSSLVGVLLVGAVIVATYIAGYLSVGASSMERALVGRLLSQAVRRLRPASH